MGLFGVKNSYEIGNRLRPKNGNTHVLFIHTVDKIDEDKINDIIDNMQDDGYEIIDVKLAIGGTQIAFSEIVLTYK